MAKTLKVVDVAQEAQPAIEETQIEQPIEEPIQEESAKEVVVEEPSNQEPIHGKTAKTPEEIVCEHCNNKNVNENLQIFASKDLQSNPSTTSTTSTSTSTNT